jgi:putative membrane protein
MKFILGIIIGILVIIFMVQNAQVVEIKFLAWTITISRALMVLIVFVFGIFIGWVVRSIGYRKKRREEQP